MKKLFYLLLLTFLVLQSCDYFDGFRSKSGDKITAIPFSNDNLRFGLVDLKGNIIVENEWENQPSIAAEGIVYVKNKDGNYEFFDASSNPQKLGSVYTDVTLFSEGLAAVVNEKGFIHYIDHYGDIKFELLDDGKGIPIKKAGVFSEGLARFQNDENLWGFIDKNGNVVIKPRYDFVRNFKEGLAMVERYNQSTNERTIGFIDKMDNEIIPLSERYTAFSDFSEGYAACTDKASKDQWGYIDKNGNRVIDINKTRVKVMPFQYQSAVFYDGLYWGMIDHLGNVKVNPKYDKLLANYQNGLAPFKTSSNEIGFITPDRKEVIKAQYEEVLPFYANTTVVKDKYYVFIDKKGNSVSKTYLKYVPIKTIIDQVENYRNSIVRNLYINVNSLVNALIESVSAETINGINFNSDVRDVMKAYKVSRSGLPQNTYQSHIQFTTELPGIGDPCQVKIGFNESVFLYNRFQNLDLNDRATVKSIEYRVFAKNAEASQIQAIAEKMLSLFLEAGFEFNSSLPSRMANGETYKLNGTVLEKATSSSEIRFNIDYSAYY